MDGCKKQRICPRDSFPDLFAAACELRAASSKLTDMGEETANIEAFYRRLNNLTCEVSPWYKPIIVSVEGVKDRRLQDLVDMFPGSVRLATPPASLSVAKSFQKLGENVARAFQMVSIAMAVQECRDVCMAEHQPVVFVVANFCALAFGLTDFSVWPPGLLKPKLQILVQDSSEPDEFLVKVSRALQELEVEQISIKCPEEPEEQMLQMVKAEINKRIFPSTEDLKSLGDPLRYLVNVARKEGLLGDRAGDKPWQLGRRGKHIPWSFQLATLNRDPAGPPALRNLGIHSVTETGFIFFTLGSAGGASGQAGEELVASMVLLLGSYPFQQQWRAEGIVRKMRGSPPPPFSLACAMQRCSEIAQDQLSGTRASLSDQEAVLGVRADDAREGPCTAYMFIPRRMEVLIGHPPAPGGTRRCEWQRSALRVWEGPKVLLPFSPSPVASLGVERPRLQKATVVIMGAHTAGKSTVRKRVAERMQWQSDEELGTSLRGEQEEQGNYGDAWDDTIHAAEIERDGRSKLTSRVVETWHLGNFVWALTRCPELKEDLLNRAIDAIRQEQEGGIVLFVLLKINAATMLRRRAKFQTSALAFQDEETDATNLWKATGEKLDEMMACHRFNVPVPVLKLDNNRDGETALNDTVDAIVDFITFFV